MSKAEGDRLVQRLIARDGLPATIVRPGTLFGPGDRMNFGRIADRVRSGKAVIVGSGTNPVPFVYITDVVDALLLAFDSDRRTFVATATAVGLVVDAARMPVYIITERLALLQIRLLIGIAIAGVVAGTLTGTRVLRHVPERQFRRIVAVLLLALGTWMLFGSSGH